MELVINDFKIDTLDDKFNSTALWRAKGKPTTKRPYDFMATETFKSLEAHYLKMGNFPIFKIKGKNGGTYMIKELIYAYAMYLDVEFYAYVLSVFDQHVMNIIDEKKELQNTISVYKNKDNTLLYDTCFTASQFGHLTELGQRKIFDRLCNFGLLSHTPNCHGGHYTILPKGETWCRYNTSGTVLINKSMEDYLRNNVSPDTVLMIEYDKKLDILSSFFE